MRSINVSSMGNNCGLYAVGLGLKKAIQKGVAQDPHFMEGRAAPLQHIASLLHQYTEEDFISSPDTAVLGSLLRKELALAFRNSANFKERQKAAFVNAIARMRKKQGPSGDIHPELLNAYYTKYQLQKDPTEGLERFWDHQLFEEYVLDMAAGTLFISDEELKCVATYWDINLGISQAGQESEISKMEIPNNGNNSNIGFVIWNPGQGYDSARGHWQYLDFDAAPENTSVVVGKPAENQHITTKFKEELWGQLQKGLQLHYGARTNVTPVKEQETESASGLSVRITETNEAQGEKSYQFEMRESSAEANVIEFWTEPFSKKAGKQECWRKAELLIEGFIEQASITKCTDLEITTQDTELGSFLCAYARAIHKADKILKKGDPHHCVSISRIGVSHAIDQVQLDEAFNKRVKAFADKYLKEKQERASKTTPKPKTVCSPG